LWHLADRCVWAACIAAFVACGVPAGAQAPATVNEGQWLDLFDGESLFGWNVVGDAQWTVAAGALTCETGAGGLIATTSSFGDFELTARVRLGTETSAGVLVRSPLEGHWSTNGATLIPLEASKGDEADWRDLVVTARGDGVTATLGGEKLKVTGGGQAVGHIAILYPRREGKVEVAAVRLRPLGLRPLFNGTTLDGWNIIQGHK